MRKLMMAVATLALVAGCRESVQEKREDVAEARQDLVQERQDAAQEIREEAREQGQDLAEARQEVQEERQDLAETRRERMQQGAQADATSVQGRVQATEGDALVLIVQGQGQVAGRELRLNTDEQTRVMQDNRPIELDQVQQGSEVRASYIPQGDELVAREVIIIAPMGGQ